MCKVGSTNSLKWAELIVISIGIIVSVFALIEIRIQTRVNAEQISVLKRNSEIENKLTIFRDFYPKYAISNVEYTTKDTVVYVKFTITNYSDYPLALDTYHLFKVYNCGTNKSIDFGGIDPKTVEKKLRDSSHFSIAPGAEVSRTIDLTLPPEAINEIKLTRANFAVMSIHFLRLENIEYFDGFIDEVGSDLSDSFEVNSEVVNLPPNTKRVYFNAPVKWIGSTLKISDFKGCVVDTVQ